MVLSGENVFAFFWVYLSVLVFSCLSGFITAYIHVRFSRFNHRYRLLNAIDLGNLIPLGIFNIVTFFFASPDVESYILLFTFGWLIVSFFPALIANHFVEKKLDTFYSD